MSQGDTDGDVSDSADATDPSEADAEDPFRGERPAIRLVENPDCRRDSDKIIDLEARRTRTRDGLSPGEQAAFREIGVRLNESSTAGTDNADAQSLAPDQQEDRPSFGKRQSLADDDMTIAGDIEVDFDTVPAAESPDSQEPAGTGSGDEIPASAEAGESASDADSQPDTPEQDLADSPSPEVEWIEPTVIEPLPSAFALPARQVMQPGLDAGLVDAIPAALLVHAGDDLIHANAEFLELTGYRTLHELADFGGLDHLLDRSDDETADDEGGMLIRRADGGTLNVTARLRSVNWGDGQALLLALSPIKTGADLVDAITPIEAEALAEADTIEPDAVEPDAVEMDGASEEDTDADESAALKIEAQELRSILETATDGVVILDNDGTIRSMNGSACALFNYDEGETQGQPFAMLFAHESQRAVMDYVSGLAEHGVSSVLNDGREVIGPRGFGRLPATVHDHRASVGLERLLRRAARHHPVEADRGGAAHCQARGGDRKFPQVGLPRPGQPRDPHAAQRHHRLLRNDGGGTFRPDRQPALSGIRPRHRQFRQACARHRQRPAGHFKDRGRPGADGICRGLAQRPSGGKACRCCSRWPTASG